MESNAQSTDFSATAEFGWTNSAFDGHLLYTMPALLKELARVDAKRILDIGSGNGAMANHLHALGFEMVGMDCDKAGVEISRQSFPHVRFYQFAVEDDPDLLLRSEGKSFDCVVSTEVIEHLFAPHLLVRYAAGVLDPGGIFIVSTPYHGYWKNLLMAIAGRWDHHLGPWWWGGHIKFWSRKSLTAFLEANGFEVIGFRGCGRVPYLWKGMVLTARKKSLHAPQGKSGLNLQTPLPAGAPNT